MKKDKKMNPENRKAFFAKGGTNTTTSHLQQGIDTELLKELANTTPRQCNILNRNHLGNCRRKINHTGTHCFTSLCTKHESF